MDNINDNKIDVKDIYNTYWKCRDFELANLWQRSIFLTAFLVLCFTAYGAILNSMFSYLVPKNQMPFIVLNLIAYALSLVGIIFSIFWIKMSKGSKMWYERYEKAIKAIEIDTDYATDDAVEIGGFGYENLKKYEKMNINNSLFSTDAGAFSVSRINIGIGQVFLILWQIIGITHLIIISINIGCINNSNLWSILSLCVGIIIMLIISLVFSVPKRFKSTAF